MLRRFVPIVLAVTAVSCAGNPAEPDVSLADLRNTPTTVTLEGKPVEIAVSLWRDFMPISPPDGKPLTMVLRTQSSSPVSDIVRAWVVNGSDVWNSAPERNAGTADWVSRDGPKWTPGTRVDVVVRLRAQGGSETRLRIPSVLIERTD